jgi:hypothetical protein
MNAPDSANLAQTGKRGGQVTGYPNLRFSNVWRLVQRHAAGDSEYQQAKPVSDGLVRENEREVPLDGSANHLGVCSWKRNLLALVYLFACYFL